MKQTSILTRNLANVQEEHARRASIVTDATFRLYMEDCSAPGTVGHAVARYFPAFTQWFATGHWQGNPEPAIVVEIVTAKRNRGQVLALAESLRVLLSQSCILVTCSDATSTLVTGE